MQKLIEFCTSVYMLYIICGCWLLNYLYMSSKNKKLSRKCDELQKENVTIYDDLKSLSEENEYLLLKIEDMEKEV